MTKPAEDRVAGEFNPAGRLILRDINLCAWKLVVLGISTAHLPLVFDRCTGFARAT
jgi:hypothetical protein